MKYNIFFFLTIHLPIFSCRLCKNCYNMTKFIRKVTTSKKKKYFLMGNDPELVHLFLTGSGSTTLTGSTAGPRV